MEDEFGKLLAAVNKDGEFSFSQKNGKKTVSIKCNHIVAMDGICDIIDACAKNITCNSDLFAFLSVIKEECEELMPKGKCECNGE